MHPRILRRGGVAAVAATLLLVTPASAHPYLDPGQAPIDSVAGLTLELGHGCGVDDHGDGDHDHDADEQPTRQVAIEVPSAVAWVDAAETDGWDLELERDDAGAVEVMVYTAEPGTDVPAPAFELEAVHEGEVGDEVHWRVMQACDDVTYRWVGTPDEPAEDPAVAVTLAEADPDAPPRPPEQTDAGADAEEPDEQIAEDADDGHDEAEEALADADAGSEDADESTTAIDEGGLPGWALIVLLLGALGIAGAVLLRRTRQEDETDPDTPGAADPRP